MTNASLPSSTTHLLFSSIINSFSSHYHNSFFMLSFISSRPHFNSLSPLASQSRSAVGNVHVIVINDLFAWCPLPPSALQAAAKWP